MQKTALKVNNKKNKISKLEAYLNAMLLNSLKTFDTEHKGQDLTVNYLMKTGQFELPNKGEKAS